MKYDNTGYGPILETLENELSPYIKFSEQAYRYYIEGLSSKAHLLRKKDYKTFNLLLSNAKNASFSIRLLSTWGQPIEGYALLRIRLEQLIISSYLIHEESEKGINAFKKYEPIIEYDLLKANATNYNLKMALSSLFPNSNLDYEKRMSELREKIEDTYEIKNEKFQRKWTTLPINKLAEQRDKLVNVDDRISNVKLLDFYNTIYKISSSIIHSDVASISSNFIKTSNDSIITPQELYVFTNIIMLSQFDMIQCYETSKKFQLNIEDKYLKLYDKYLIKIKGDFEI